MNRKSTVTYCLFILLVTFILGVACSDGESAYLGATAVVFEPGISRVDAENQIESLVVYSGRSESLLGPLIGQFRISSGIDVSVKYGKTSEIAALMLEEGEKSPADVFFAQDPGGFGEVVKMMDTLPGSLLELSPEWARSPEGKWIGISGRARVVAYNTNSVNQKTCPNQ